MAVVLLVGGRANETDAARLQIGLEHIRGVHRTLADGTRTHQGVNLVDIHNVLIALFKDAIHNLLDAVLEIATILGAGKQRTNVELVNTAAFQSLGHTTLLYHTGQAPDKCSLTHTRLAHMQRIILVFATKHLNGSLQLGFATDEGIVILVQVVHTGNQFAPGFL